MMAIALEQGSNRFEWDHVRSDGEVFPVEVLLTAVRRAGREIIHVVWRDITERRELEARLRLAQKMEAVGRMAGGIAHDFNNLLVAIMGNSDLLAESLADDPDQMACVDEIQGAAHRAAALIRQLMAFSRKQDVQATVVDVPAALRDLENILHRLLDERYSLDLRLCPEPVRILAGLGQLEQIIINLVTNARDAMPNGGELTVELRLFEVSSALRGVDVELRPGTYAAISVTDLGHGMTPEVTRRAFDPFFTTKEIGKGTGLGLATVYAIAKHSGGGVDIQSDVGHGTTVRVFLPITTAHSQADGNGLVPPAELRGTETVLVVEDELAVATLEVRVLRAAGYRVLLAKDGLEALDVYSGSTVPIDLVVTDVVMPRLGGVDLVRRLRTAAYQGAVLMTSGYTNDEMDRAADLGSEIDMLEKPYTTAELLSRVRAALGRRRV
jgi:signal transduction histidine kinase/CheY-like chemotaxis protein